jgi:hypothetical protein
MARKQEPEDVEQQDEEEEEETQGVEDEESTTSIDITESTITVTVPRDGNEAETLNRLSSLVENLGQ